MSSRTNQYQPDFVSHPGETLREALEEKQMGSKEFAIRISKPEQTVSKVLNGKSGITPEMAVLFEEVLDIPARFWSNRQYQYDEFLARSNRMKEIESDKDWVKSFPYPYMSKLGWVPSCRKGEEKLINLFSFFKITSVKSWEDYYFNKKLATQYRISLRGAKNPYALAAWLRKGEIDALSIDANEYSEKFFKEKLQSIKELMAFSSGGYLRKLQELSLEAGVKVVFTPCLPKTPVHGCSRWINESPVIQLSGKYKRNDIFWFTFFHEAAHILLHGKKYVSVENIDCDGENAEYEHEANEFAAHWLLTLDQEQEIKESAPLSNNDIRTFAQKFRTHPACIIGRLQHRGLLTHHEGREHFESVDIANY